jgi:uncharacterized damage-inducible protein DinB
MDIVDRLLAHDIWTTRQLLIACQALPDAVLDQEFEIDHTSLRKTFAHMLENLEGWTDLIDGRPARQREGNSIEQFIARLGAAGRDFAHVTRKIVREQRYDDCFLDTEDTPPRLKTFGGPSRMSSPTTCTTAPRSCS